jgi:histidinol-phosphate phosphatase family protein
LRLLVLADGFGSGSRLRAAALGLALRGHRVAWKEKDGIALGDAAKSVERISHGTSGVQADAVLGGGGAVMPTAVAGWLSGAHVMVLDLAGRAQPWTWWERWAFGSLRSSAMLEQVSLPGPSEPLHGIDADRIGAWSDAALPDTPDSAHPDVDALERWLEHELARRDGDAGKPAVFLDRDGTLVIERHYLSEADQIELLPGAARALGRLRSAGYRLIVISNQAGVGRGLFDLGQVHEAMARLRRDLRNEGIELDAVYFCPHAPDAGCDCRKPGIGMLRDAAANQMLALRRSYVVGDRLIDVATASNAGATGILVRTGYGEAEAATLEGGGEPRPEFVAADLADAADWILAGGHAAD